MIGLDSSLILETAADLYEESVNADYSFIDGFINESEVEEGLPYV